jgi:hypothetical protein
MSEDKPQHVVGYEGPGFDEEFATDWFFAWGNGRSVIVSEKDGYGLHICVWKQEFSDLLTAIHTRRPDTCYNYGPGSQPDIEGHPECFGILASYFLLHDLRRSALDHTLSGN